MRIVSLAPSNTEILFELGAGDEVVAVTRYCDYPPEARNLPKIGGWLDVNDELVKQFKPDLVIASTFLQDRIVAREKKLGVNVFSVDPKTLEDVFNSIMQIGIMVERENEAIELVKDLRARFDILKAKYARAKKVRVYAEEWHKPPSVSGNWVPKIIEAVGGISLCQQGVRSYPVHTHQVVEFDPEVIIMSLCGFGAKDMTDEVYNRKDWKGITAVKKKNVFVIDDSLLNRPGPRLVEGAEELAEILERVRKRK